MPTTRPVPSSPWQLVYLCHDSAKRQAAPSTPISLLAHTSVPYGLRRIGSGTTDADVETDLRARVHKLMPWLPEAASSALYTWRHSQVRTPLPQGDSGACLPLSPPPTHEPAAAHPPLVLAGDAFAPLGSRFDGCVQSGEAAAAALLAALSRLEE